jgi:hypothetical protein
VKIRKRIFILAFLITAFLFLTIILLGSILNNERKTYVADQMSIINDLNEVQTYLLLSEVYGQKIACLAFKKKLSEWDQTLWDLGIKIDNYRVATEEFQKDPFYLEQKKRFNENEALYMAFLTKVKNECELNTIIISFFFKNSAHCPKCDDQSFVLSDLKREFKDEISVFSYDKDLEVPTVDLLAEYYEINEYPCIVINEKRHCGMQDKKFIIGQICENTVLPACSKISGKQ